MKKLFTLLMLMVCAIGTAWAGDVFEVKFQNSNSITETPSGYFKWDKGEGAAVSWSSKGKHSCTYNGDTYSDVIKMESATQAYFSSTAKATVTIVQTTSNATGDKLKFDGNNLDANLANTTVTVDADNKCNIYVITDVKAGDHKITRQSETGLAYIKVEYTGATMTQLSTPEITIDATTGDVTIGSVTNATKVTYTTDGTDPTAESTQYTAAFTVEDGVIVKAIAIGDNKSYINSDIASKLAILEGATIATPVIKQSNGTVAITCETAGTTIEYSLDGEKYTTYSRAFTLTENGTVYARAKRGEKVSEGISTTVTTISKGEATKTIYLSYGAFTPSADNKTLTGAEGNPAEGFTITMDQTGDGKTFSGGNKITTPGGSLTTIKGSNGRQIKVEIPSNVTATRLTLYSYQNSTGSVSGWKEVGGQDTEYTSIPMGAYGEDTATPDVRVYKLENLSGTTLTFNNAGVQLCFVAALDVIESQDPTLKATSEIAVKATPFNKTSTATIKLTGSNLENNTYNVVMPEVEGLSISPATFTVADGAVEQTFTVTYTSDSDVESATANIVFVAGSTQALTVVNYMSHVTPYELTAISTAKTWDFSQLTANNNSTLYGSEGIKLNSETTPSSQEEVVYENFNGSDVTIESSFDGTAIAFKGEFPIRKNTFAQNGTIIFETTVPGKIKVDFSDTGSSGDNPAKRYLIVNNQPTAFYTQRTGSSNDKKTNCEISVPAGKVTISSTQAVCIYKISFTPADVPTITATITNAGYATFSSLFEVEIPDGVEAYYASASEGSTVTMTSIDGGVIPAGTGVVLKGAEGSYTMAVSNTGATLDGTNLLKANIADRTPGEAEYYTLAAGKAYLVIPGGSARTITMKFSGEATGISELKSVAEEGALYNLSGARVSKPTKGLYIQNGKKLIVK